MITVNSWEDLFKTGVKIVTEQIEPDELEIKEDMVFKVRVRGHSWDGSIDYRGAKYILELQKAINDIYLSTVQGKRLRDLSKLVTVKVKVVEGSSIFEIKLYEILKLMVGNMSSEQTTLIAICCIFSAAGYLTIRKILDYKKAIITNAQQNQLTETAINKLTGALNKSIDVIQRKDLEAPNRKLIGRLEEDDTIQFHGQTEISVKEAKKLYPRKEKSALVGGHFDDKYIITMINLEKQPIQFHLKKGDFEFKAEAELTNKDIEQIAKDLEISWKDKLDFILPLHVFIHYNNNGIFSASVQGTGDPREDAEDIDRLIRIWKKIA